MVKKVLLSIVLLALSFASYSQITAVGNCGAFLTDYTNSASNDSVYLYGDGAVATLNAASPSGTGPFDFLWQTFVPSSNSWTAFTTQLDQPNSSITNLVPGAYRVSIFDASNNFVIAYQVWVAFIITPADPAPSGGDCIQMESNCIETHLWVQFPAGSGATMTPIYDLPGAPFIVNTNTDVTVCFSGNHTWVSDLGFFLVGPPSCGSPVISLAPNPGSIGQGSVCNSGNNISNLCFSTESTTNFNVCTAATPLTGSYGTYGATPTNIAWANLYGCDVNAGGWAVQIFDCIGLDTGALTDATLTFAGQNSNGVQTNVVYSTPPGYSSAINDNSCSQASASIFQVSTPTATALPYTLHWEWNADPYVFIADSLDDFDITLPSPSVPTVFTLTLVALDANGDYVYFSETDEWTSFNACSGLVACDLSVNFTPSGYTTPVISGPSQICQGESVLLFADIPGGQWSGPGINSFGQIGSANATAAYTYTINQPCYDPAIFNLVVMPDLVQTYGLNLGEVCVNGSIVDIPAFGPNAFFIGPGVTSIGAMATFDPSASGPGSFIIMETGSDPTMCMTYTANYQIVVNDIPLVDISPVADICETSSPVALISNVPNGNWFGPGVIGNMFDPSVGEGTYTINFISPDNCDASGSIDIVVGALPIVTISDPGLLCADGSPVNLQASATGGFWSGPGMTDATFGTFDPTTTGDGTFTVNYATGGICPTSTDYDVFVTPLPTPDAGDDVTICEGDFAQLAVNTGWDDVVWSTSDETYLITVDQPGVYTVTATLDGCSATDAVQVFVTSMPVIDLGDDVQNVCEGSTITIFSGYDGEWSNGDMGNSTTVGTEGNLSFVYPNSGCPVYDTIFVDVIEYPVIDLGPDAEICPQDSITLSTNGVIGSWNLGYSGTEITVNAEADYIFTSSNWVCSTIDTLTVSWIDLPVLNLEEVMEGCTEEPLLIDASHVANQYYLWSTGDTTSFIYVTVPGPYSVTLGNECGELTDQTVVELQDCSPSVYIPNTFTPNNDGLNDVWMPVINGILEFELRVFDRWGDLVYYTNDPHSPWQGSMNSSGYYAPDGVYSYRFDYHDVRNDKKILFGSVMIIR